MIYSIIKMAGGKMWNVSKKDKVIPVKVVKSKRKVTKKRNQSSIMRYNLMTPVSLDELIICDNIQEQYGAYSFSLNQVQDYLKFVALYDQYRIVSVSVLFQPVMTTQIIKATVNGPTNNIEIQTQTPYFYVCKDFDDANPPVSVNELRGREGCIMRPATRSVSLTFKPKTVTPVYKDGVSFAYKLSSLSDWIDCSNTTVPYYGLKWALETNNDDGAYIYRMTYKIKVEFKGLRS